MIHNVFIIAEIAQTHDGSLGILHSLIDALAKTGVDAVKFQVHIADAESSIYEPFRINFSYVDSSRYDYWKRMEFSFEQWQSIKNHCEENSMEFIASPFSNAAVDYLERLNVKRYKIGSGEITNHLLLEKIRYTEKPIILSSGMSSFLELDAAVNFLMKSSNELSILQCTSKYPTMPNEIGLNVLNELKNRYGLPTGLSDHSGKIFPSLAAVSLGAQIIEIHATFDRRMFGPDSSSSLTIDEIRLLVEGIRFLEISMKSPINKNVQTDFEKVKKIFEKSLSLNKSLTKNSVLRFEDLEGKKPAGMGIPASIFSHVIGRKLNRDMDKNEFLNESDLM